MFDLEAKTTALVLIDVQKGILGYPLTPLGGDELLAGSKALADQFRAAGAPVILVNVAWAPDFADGLAAPVDHSMFPADGLPADFADLADGLASEGDIRITKRQWGAFTGTELDLQLRRRGITTVMIGGVSTALGVESTARQAHELNYAVVIAASATTSVDPDTHHNSMTRIFPLIARVTDSVTLG